SYDQGYGNYTPIKKEQYREKIHAKTSIATITYDLRRMLHQEYAIYTTLATKCLKDEALKIYNVLKTEDIEKSRIQLSYIVGRDTT
ncbi:cobalamin biosynthesis protein, partial [Clostridioides difficile]